MVIFQRSTPSNIVSHFFYRNAVNRTCRPVTWGNRMSPISGDASSKPESLFWDFEMGHVSSECQLSYQNESGFLRSSLICLSIDIPKIRAQYKSKKYYFSPVLSLGSHVRLYYSSRTLAHIGARSPFFLAKFRAIFSYLSF